MKKLSVALLAWILWFEAFNGRGAIWQMAPTPPFPSVELCLEVVAGVAEKQKEKGAKITGNTIERGGVTTHLRCVPDNIDPRPR
jgi:hypothetical protein